MPCCYLDFKTSGICQKWKPYHNNDYLAKVENLFYTTSCGHLLLNMGSRLFRINFWWRCITNVQISSMTSFYVKKHLCSNAFLPLDELICSDTTLFDWKEFKIFECQELLSVLFKLWMFRFLKNVRYKYYSERKFIRKKSKACNWQGLLAQVLCPLPVAAWSHKLHIKIRL